jgi:hypothetical protein
MEFGERRRRRKECQRLLRGARIPLWLRIAFPALLLTVWAAAWRFHLMSASEFQLLGFALVGGFVLLVRWRYGRK